MESNTKLNGTALVLAGGQSRRFGSNKALAQWKGQPLIEHVVRPLKRLFTQTLIVAKKKETYQFLEAPSVRVVEDVVSESHSLGGLYSGLFHTETEHAFVCGCDMPLLEDGLIQALWADRQKWQAVAPVWHDRAQPLCAVYATQSLATVGQHIDNGQLRIQDLLQTLQTGLIPQEKTRLISPDGLSFQDIDSRDDYQQILITGQLERQFAPKISPPRD